MIILRSVGSIAVLVISMVLPAATTAQQPLPAEGDETQLLAVLDSDAELFDKAKACQRLAIIGTSKSVPGVAKLLAEPALSHYARFALEANPSPEVDRAFRDALGKLKGPQLVGVINSVATRKDIQSVVALTRLAASDDNQVAAAAVSALGALARKGFTQDSIFMFLSDHGEEMGDNDIVGHALSDTITEGLVRIPLVIASNEAAVPDLSRAVPQQLDVMPTLLDMLDLPAPRIWDGISLFTKPSDAAIFHEFGFKTTFMGLECNAVLDRVQEERLEKYIRCRSPNKPTRHQLFDIAADPNQKTNLWGKRDQATREIWEEKLDAHFQFRPGNSRGKSRLRN